jgi:hypothetical protein
MAKTIAPIPNPTPDSRDLTVTVERNILGVRTIRLDYTPTGTNDRVTIQLTQPDWPAGVGLRLRTVLEDVLATPQVIEQLTEKGYEPE